jgi:DNA-binding transcriptional LysR family regulator
MDFRRLRYFIAVAQHLSFRRAAESLNTSQPSLSQQIRALEDELGITLFERTKRQVRLTTAGTEYYQGVRALLGEFELCAERARNAQEGKRGTLGVGANGMVMFNLLPQIVHTFRDEFPEVRVSMTVLRNPDPFRALRARRIDVALTTQNDPADDIERQHLWTIPWHVVLPSCHPLARKSRIKLSELTGETLLVVPHRDSPGGYEEMLAVCREQNFVPAAIHEVTELATIETLTGLVAAGLGIAIFPSTYEQIKPPSLVFKPIALSKSSSQISICWRKGESNHLVREFVKIAGSAIVDPYSA